MTTTSPPLDPSAPAARRWLIQELSKPQYTSNREQPLQVIQRAIGDWLQSLFTNVPGTPAPIGYLLAGLGILVVIGGIIVGAYFLYGPPKRNRRSAAAGSLFGDDDERDAATLRASANAAASAGDYTTAIVEMYRALARGLGERAILNTFPGTTATGFATEASRHFPAWASRLAAAAALFDGVRYLGARGTEEGWREVSELERGLRTVRPELEAIPA